MKERKVTGNLQGFTMKNSSLWLSDREEESGYSSNWRIQEVIHQEQSPFQEISVVQTYGFGRALVLDGVVQTTERDGYIYNEMIAHVPLTCHPKPAHVAIIGGGDCGAAQEALKYPEVERVDLVEIDKRVVEVSRKHLPEVAGYGPANPRLHFFFQDGAEFIKKKPRSYDVVIVDASDPVGPATVLFERPFYENVYHALHQDGLVVCQSESPFFHAPVLQNTVRTLSQVFPFVRVYLAAVPTYPGGIWSFTIASKTCDPSQADLSRLRSEEARYINRGVFRAAFQLPNYVQKLLKAKGK